MWYSNNVFYVEVTVMIFLRDFYLLDEEKEYNLLNSEKRRIFNNVYPFLIYPEKEFDTIHFETITIFYGDNGSGKTTLINIIAEKLQADKKNRTHQSPYFASYVQACSKEMSINRQDEIKMISSDDVFDYLLDLHSINSGVNRSKDQLCDEYLHYKFTASSDFLADYDQLRESNKAKHQTMSRYVREHLGNNNIIEQSNGESALEYWEKEIKENGIYLLDEPENSLSAPNQLKLKQFIEDSARFYNCQFIISTHSPFLLAIKDAKIYDLDARPVTTKKWEELENVKVYYTFFKDSKNKFK